MMFIIIVGIAAYSNSFSVPFVYDDLGNIVGNQALENYQLGDIESYWGMRSLPQVTLALNYRLGPDIVWHYHVMNLAIDG